MLTNSFFSLSFLTDSREWIQCLEPAHVVEWNIILFSILIALSGLQVIVCLIRVVIQLSKSLCGTYSVIIQVPDPPWHLYLLLCPGFNVSCWRLFGIASFSFHSYCPHLYSASNISIFPYIPVCLLACLNGLNQRNNYKIIFCVPWWNVAHSNVLNEQHFYVEITQSSKKSDHSLRMSLFIKLSKAHNLIPVK